MKKLARERKTLEVRDVARTRSRFEAYDDDFDLLTLAAPDEGETMDDPDADPWVIVLAGGEGRRLEQFTRDRDGSAVPKQFCHFRDERTLLGATLDRALGIANREHILVVVLASHRRWWQSEVDWLPEENVIVQPFGRGTAVAILLALTEVRRRDPEGRVVVMPSDHDFEDEATLTRCIHDALQIAERHPEDLVLLGIVPSHLDAEYGLIEPGESRARDGKPVRAFFEKPSLTLAAELTRVGALWNSFIFACTGSALEDVLEAALPWLARTGRASLLEGGRDSLALNRMFEGLPACDFSRDVLERHADRLRLVEVPSCGWTDLGTPARLAGWLGRHREALFWREHPIPLFHGSDGFPGSLQAGGAP